MESNLCNGNHSDSNVILPPRKRLLAGFKKQNSDPDSNHPSKSNEKTVFDNRVSDFVKFHLENPNFSLEEIVAKSGRAVKEAVEVAVAARAVAEEKAVVAAKAMAEAKKALELVATISDEVYQPDKHLKKQNKTKKHLPVKVLYNKPKKAENLLHVTNSSKRITENSENSNLKTNKYKRAKNLLTEGPKDTSKGHSESESEERNSKYLISEREAIEVSGNRNSATVNDNAGVGRKRGRMKQKKLPLSICSFRDLANRNNDEIRSNKESNMANNVAPNMWKCKAFKAPPSCVGSNKVMEP